MEVVNRMLAVLGQILLWVSTMLVLEELTLGGLARLLLSTTFDARERRLRHARDVAASCRAERSLEVDSKDVQGGVSCSQ
jgi:hypothetical protein